MTADTKPISQFNPILQDGVTVKNNLSITPETTYYPLFLIHSEKIKLEELT